MSACKGAYHASVWWGGAGRIVVVLARPAPPQAISQLSAQSITMGNKECTIGSLQTDFVTRPHDALINQSPLAVVDADASR